MNIKFINKIYYDKNNKLIREYDVMFEIYVMIKCNNRYNVKNCEVK